MSVRYLHFVQLFSLSGPSGDCVDRGALIVELAWAGTGIVAKEPQFHARCRSTCPLETVTETSTDHMDAAERLMAELRDLLGLLGDRP